jgi:hypothetical protein
MAVEPRSRGRYRWRTALRSRLPFVLIRLVPKGRHDCGNHEWYRSQLDFDRCYHCQLGLRSSAPVASGRAPEPSARAAA